MRREALDQMFEAREELVLHEEPERVPVLGFLWWDGEPAGETIPRGKCRRLSHTCSKGPSPPIGAVFRAFVACRLIPAAFFPASWGG